MDRLYRAVKDAIDDYYQNSQEWDCEEWLQAIEDAAKRIHPNQDVLIFDYDTGNDTYELDRQLDDIIGAMTKYDCVEYCNVWDDQTVVTVICANKKKDV